MKTDDARTKIKLLDTNELLKKLASKFPAPAYAFLTQVRNGTGYLNITRTADAMVMSLWPSRGLELIGFELKASRSDWLREWKNPDKAEDLVSFCDRWYVVAAGDGIVNMEELPANWGLMTATGRGGAIKTIKEAPKLEPITIDRLFLASIFRNITERTISRDLVDAEIETRFNKEREGWERSRDDAWKEREAARKIISDFTAATGLPLSYWSEDSNKKLVELIKEVRDGKYADMREKVLELKKIALNIAKFADGEIQKYEI